MEQFQINDKDCVVEQFTNNPGALIILLCGNEGEKTIERLKPLILPHIETKKCRPFLLATFSPVDWEKDYSPWRFVTDNNRIFAGEADKTIHFINSRLIPTLKAQYSFPEIYFVGYSLGGLTAIYAHCLHHYNGCASCSGSLWYPRFTDFIKEHLPDGKIYLSLGGKESHTSNILMSTVDTATSETKRIITNTSQSIYVKESGGHFKDIDGRIARAILWLLR